MQQHRQPRLGDILDDYCPRERRITNHAVVAMVGPDIKQTRCTTCDAEHEYKHAKVPATRKKKEAPSALYKQVLSSAQPVGAHPADAESPEDQADGAAPPAPIAAAEAPAPPAPAPAQEAAAPEAAAEEAQEPTTGEDEGPVHRRLIRATLPRPEGVPTQRPLPQFTVRQPGKFNNANGRGGRPQGMGSMTRPRNSPSRAAFGRNGSRGDSFTTRSSNLSHQRTRPGHRPSGRPVRHGKKSPK